MKEKKGRGFIPGISGNPAGRPKGKANKVTTSVREVLAACINDEMESLPETLKQLEPRDRVDAIVKLLPYIMPKMPETQQENQAEDNRLGFVELIKNQFASIEGTIVYNQVDNGVVNTIEYNPATEEKKVLE